MIAGARYAHTNLVAQDWRALAGFGLSRGWTADVPRPQDSMSTSAGRLLGW